MVMHNRPPTLKPQMNRSPIETLAMQPYRIIAIPGGISGVIIAEAAVTTEENSFENPFFSISGTSILASIAASAMLEPDRPPIRVDSRTLTCARPPCMRPVMASQKPMMREVTPV